MLLFLVTLKNFDQLHALFSKGVYKPLAGSCTLALCTPALNFVCLFVHPVDTGGMDLGGMGLGQPGPSRAANPFTSPFASALGSAATTRPADSAPSGTSFLRSSALGKVSSPVS